MKIPVVRFPARALGFTLLELMTAVTVLAILLGIGVPTFTSIIRANQIAAESNNLVSALNFARSESMKRGVRVSVCPATADGGSCDDEDLDWGNGWIVFADDFGTAGVMDVNDLTIQTWSAPANGVMVSTAAAAVTFQRTASALAAVTFSVTKEGCTAGQKRDIAVDPSGRISLSKQDCTG